jgi:hypothetical protein
VIEVSEIIAHEAHEAGEPNVLADLFDADALAGKDGTEIDFLPIETDAPT